MIDDDLPAAAAKNCSLVCARQSCKRGRGLGGGDDQDRKVLQRLTAPTSSSNTRLAGEAPEMLPSTASAR